MNENATNVLPASCRQKTKTHGRQDAGRTMAVLAVLAFSSVLALAIFVGSHVLRNFDPALVWYALASVLAAFAVC